MKRAIFRATTAVAAVSAAALFFPAVASAADPVPDWCAPLSTEATPAGWGNSFLDEPNQAPVYSETNVDDTDGSLEFTTSETEKRKATYHTAGFKLKDLAVDSLSFSQEGSPATWQIRLINADSSESNGFATLYATGSNAGDWHSTRALGVSTENPIAKNATATLEALIDAAGDDAIVEHYGISLQPGGSGGIAHVDNVTFNGCTTNFAKESVEVPGDGDGDGNSSSLGGFGLANLIPGLS